MPKTQARKARERQQRERREQEARTARIVAHFEDFYGHDDTKLEKWQRLCRDVGVPERSSITQCKKELKGIYINIVDFVDAYNNDRKPRLFRSYKALQSYILNDKTKIFPKNEAKGNPILKWMLIGVF